jgi:interleukin-1 receptor-associated kinase 1
MIELTRNGGSPNIHNSVGRVLLTRPVLLWDTVTSDMARFTTAFSLGIKATAANGGDVLSFFLGYYPSTAIHDTIENSQNLSLFNKNASMVVTGDDRVVAVEFNTFLNDGIDTSNSQGTDVRKIETIVL